MDLDYPLHPTPGTPAAQRKAELDAARFVEVRNLAYMIYKRPDQTPLMTYQETLDNREDAKWAVIRHEIAVGLVSDDGSVPQSSNPQPAAVPAAQPQPNGVAAMNPPQVPMPFPSPAAPPPAAVAAAPVGAPPPQPAYAAAPGYAPAPAAAPYPPQAPAGFPPPPNGYAPPPAAPQAAPQPMAPPAGLPASEAAAAAPAGGRRRRGAGAAVAPPPQQAALAPPGFGAPPPAPNNGVPVAAAPAGYAPPPPMAAPAPAFAPPPAATVAAPVGSAFQVDTRALEAKVENLTAAVTAMGKLHEATVAELRNVKSIAATALGALHHMYLSTASLGQAANGQAQDLPSFVKYMEKFLGGMGNSANPN